MHRPLLLVCLSVVVFCPAAFAQRGEQRLRPVDPLTRAIDRNGDGVLSAAEVAEAAKSLSRLDANDDGAIDRFEMRDAFRRAMGRGGAPGGNRSRMSGIMGGLGGGASTLERAGLKIGQPLPKLTIHDDKGNDFRLSDVKGKYAVIVFGCLT